MNRYFNEIMQLMGAEEFKAQIRKWDQLSANLKKNPPERPVLLPNLLWVGNSGIGRTRLMALMSEFLAAKENLMDFYGDTKFFEFLLSYTPKGTPFTELQRLEEELDAAAGFRSEFRGAILIDINAWVNHYEELYFAGFMEYLSAHRDKWMIVLSVKELPEEKLHNLQAFLSMYLRLDKITLTLPETDDLCRYVAKKLDEYGLQMDESAHALLRRTLDEFRSNQYFDGFNSINMLCQEIVYEHYSTPDFTDRVLTADDLEAFAPESDYVKKVIRNSAKMHKIGFGREED